MLSFGAAPASSCGKGNSSKLPDYLPEEDDDVVISDKVSMWESIFYSSISPKRHAGCFLCFTLLLGRQTLAS